MYVMARNCYYLELRDCVDINFLREWNHVMKGDKLKPILQILFFL